MASIPLLDHRLLFLTGKGGTGKSTLACALGLLAARRGKRALVVEMDHFPAARALLGVPHVGFVPLETATPGLFAVNVDPAEAIREYLQQYIPVKRVAQAIVDNRVLNYFFKAAPSVYELGAFHKIMALAESPDPTTGQSFDFVVVDLPATGHAVTFLDTPRSVAQVLEKGPLGAIVARMLGLLRDPRTALGLVALPEEMPVNETAELYQRVHAWGHPRVAFTIVNRVRPPPFDDEQLRLLAKLETRMVERAIPDLITDGGGREIPTEGPLSVPTQAATPTSPTLAPEALLARALAAGTREREAYTRERALLADLRRRVPLPTVELPPYERVEADTLHSLTRLLEERLSIVPGPGGF